MNHSESVHVGEKCPPLQFGPNRVFPLQCSPEGVVIFAIASYFDFEPGHCSRIRNELRELGATLYLFVDTGLWRFRAEDDVECMINTSELTDSICTSFRAAWGLRSVAQELDKFALFVIDSQSRVRFIRYGSEGGSSAALQLGPRRPAGTWLLDGIFSAIEVVRPNAKWQLSRRESVV